MTERGTHVDLDIADDAIDAGLRAWFAVRVVRADSPILRDRLRAAIATALAAHHADLARPSTSGHPPQHRAGR